MSQTLTHVRYAIRSHAITFTLRRRSQSVTKTLFLSVFWTRAHPHAHPATPTLTQKRPQTIWSFSHSHKLTFLSFATTSTVCFTFVVVVEGLLPSLLLDLSFSLSSFVRVRFRAKEFDIYIEVEEVALLLAAAERCFCTFAEQILRKNKNWMSRIFLPISCTYDCFTSA